MSTTDVFEIGNEVWNYMSAEEFAGWTHLVVPAVLAVRPTAKIGADPGSGDKFTRRFLHAKGMDGLGLLFDHPYSFTPPPEHRTRPALLWTGASCIWWGSAPTWRNG